jgi:[acyl-carrier-protein] S-malonyltransferase
MNNVLVFPGQGSQSIGMMKSYTSNVVKEVFSKASEIINEDLLGLVENENEKINQTIYTQPIMLAAGYATFLILKDKKPSFSFDFLAGHSLGEITALLAGDVFSYEDSIKIVKKRSELMQNAVPEGKGAMAAILGLEDEKVEQICADLKDHGVIEPVNYNSPGQIVIAGEKELIESSLEKFKEQGAKRALLLPVSVPSHCSLMKEAGQSFSDYLDQIVFNEPNVPIIQNVNAKPTVNPDDLKRNLVAQLSNPVRWTESVKLMESEGLNCLVECGPGKVLTGLNKRILQPSDTKVLSLISDESFNEL